MGRLRLVSFVSVVACTSAPPRVIDRVAIAPECPVAPKTPPPVATPDPPSACWKNGRPTPTAPDATASTYCAALDVNEVARVEARIRKDFTGVTSPSKLVIDFGCDSAGDVEQALFESGSGHGGSLRIVLLERSPAEVRIRDLSFSEYFNKGFVLRTGRMPPADFDALIPHTRVALIARPHRVELDDPKSHRYSFAFSSSSHDFYLRLRLTGSQSVVERAFAGYASTESQEQSMPIELATEDLTKLLGTLALGVEPQVSAEDKMLFSRRFIATLQEGPRTYWWWVEERYLAFAADLGTFDIVPLLAKVTTYTGASSDRMRPVALAAIASITGWDPRKDEHGASRSDEDASRIAMKECDPARR